MTGAVVAALLVPIYFNLPLPDTSTVRPVAIEAQRRTAGTAAWSYGQLYRDSNATSPAPAPPARGTRGRAWVSVSTSPETWRAGGTEVRVGFVYADGSRTPWSNCLELIAGGAPDTAWQFQRTDTFPTPKEWCLIGPRPFVARAAGDTFPARIVHVELTQLAEAPRLCTIFGYVARRGVRDSSLCVGRGMSLEARVQQVRSRQSKEATDGPAPPR